MINFKLNNNRQKQTMVIYVFIFVFLLIVITLLIMYKSHTPIKTQVTNQDGTDETANDNALATENYFNDSFDNSSEKPTDNADNISTETPTDSSADATDKSAITNDDTDISTTQKPQAPTDDNSADDQKKLETDIPIMGPYNYDPLLILGPYEFGSHITREDLSNIKNKYNDFIENKEYLNMLDIPSDDYGSIPQILTRIDEFDNYQRSNPDLVSADEYFQNAQDRLFCYGKNNKIQILEQAAIAAEAAVESEDVIASGSYNNYITYTKTGVITFFCVFDSGQQVYDSGKAADVEFRIAKLLYKPSANLLNIDPGQRYYSLCSAYLVSQDAYKNSDSECNYAVDISYYHLKICSDMLSYIGPGEFQNEIGWEALGVYAEFKKRIEESDKSVDKKYEEDAEEMLKKINRKLGYDTLEHEEVLMLTSQ